MPRSDSPLPPASPPAQERLEREYNLDLVTTAPTVVYKCVTTDGQELTINSPADLPDATKRENISEPYVLLEMVTPKVGAWAQQWLLLWCGAMQHAR